MALVSGPLHSFDARGHVGPLVFSRGHYGQTCRGRFAPVNPASIVQTEFRQYVWGNVLLSYSVLEVSQQQAWENFATIYKSSNSLGQRINLTGRDWFIRLNIPIFRNYGITNTLPPLNACPSYLPDLTCEFDSGFGTLTFSPAIPIASGISIWQAREQPRARLHYSDYKYWGSLLYGDTSPQVITCEVGDYNCADGLQGMTPGLTCSFLFRCFDSAGRMSTDYKVNLQQTT